MSKHTPGPYKASGNGVHVYKGNVGLCVAIAYDPDRPSQCSDVAKANAKLFAAAPGLLLACREALAELDWFASQGFAVAGTRKILQDWIAKAEGEG